MLLWTCVENVGRADTGGGSPSCLSLSSAIWCVYDSWRLGAASASLGCSCDAHASINYKIFASALLRIQFECGSKIFPPKGTTSFLGTYIALILLRTIVRSIARAEKWFWPQIRGDHVSFRLSWRLIRNGWSRSNSGGSSGASAVPSRANLFKTLRSGRLIF